MNNPAMTLIPDLNERRRGDPSISGNNDTRLARRRTELGEDMLLGMSILRHLHVYIATKEMKLYITAGTAAAPTSPAKQPGQ